MSEGGGVDKDDGNDVDCNDRQVCSTWNQFIKDNVWGSAAGRSSLNRRLVNRWRNMEGKTTMVGMLRTEQVWGFYTNDTHVFCGIHRRASVAVYSLEDGTWIRDLNPILGELHVTSQHSLGINVTGGNGLVAAVSCERVATLWSSKKEMDQLFYFDVLKYGTSLSIKDMKVASGSKVVILAGSIHEVSDEKMLVVVTLEKDGDGKWNTETLSQFLDPSNGQVLASEANWVALALALDSKEELESNKRLLIWRWDEKQRKDIILPGCLGLRVKSMVLKPPFVILGLVASTYSMSGGPEAAINVYKLEPQVRDTGDLIKTIPFEGLHSAACSYSHPLKLTPDMNFSSNSHFIVLVQPSRDDNNIVHIFDQKDLLDEDISGKETWTRKLDLPSHQLESSMNFDINSTSLVYVNRIQLFKRDFWVGSSNEEQKI